MATVKFGASCDHCLKVNNDYDVGDIARCEGCNHDLCDACAVRLDHSIVKEWDVDSQRTRACPDLCIRWGLGPDRCVGEYDHRGHCFDARGRNAYALIEEAK